MKRVGYDCDVFNRMCVPQPGGRGTYATLGDCQSDCGPKCWVPEMSGPYVTPDGYWHPGKPLEGVPCVKRIVPYTELGPHHPCMSQAQCNTRFSPVHAPGPSMGAPQQIACSSATGGCCDAYGTSCPSGTTCQMSEHAQCPGIDNPGCCVADGASLLGGSVPTGCNPQMGSYPSKGQCQAESACLYTSCSQPTPGGCWQCITSQQH